MDSRGADRSSASRSSQPFRDNLSLPVSRRSADQEPPPGIQGLDRKHLRVSPPLKDIDLPSNQ
jgi:hypothetical protein